MAEENPFARLFKKPSTTVQLTVLDAGELDSPLRLRLINADPTDTLYQCISYDRSQIAGTVDVSVNDESDTLPQPLAEALHALRTLDKPRTFWVDILVGDSVAQRSSQAPTMKLVVENSDSVNSWLRPGGAQTPGAFLVFQELSDRYQQA